MVKSKINENRELDIIVGDQIKKRRIIIGMSQEELGKRVGVTFQQIQKYEKGQNRITISRLFELIEALGIDFLSFFNSFPNIESRLGLSKLAEAQEEFNSNNIDDKEITALVRAYCLINDISVRKKLLSLIRSLSPIKVD